MSGRGRREGQQVVPRQWASTCEDHTQPTPCCAAGSWGRCTWPLWRGWVGAAGGEGLGCVRAAGVVSAWVEGSEGGGVGWIHTNTMFSKLPGSLHLETTA
jgi:hypothetical protein